MADAIKLENNAKDLLRILIIDDSPEDREVMRRLLAGPEQRFRFIEAETGDAGLRICRDNGGPPDCVLLDYHLPDIDAPELLAALGGPDAPFCPVVVVTGITGGIDGRAMLRLGAQDFIGKNWMNQESLSHAIENAVERFGMVRALRDREELLQIAFDVSHTFAFEWEAATDRVLRSKGAEEILGLSREAALANTGKNYFQNIHPDDRQHCLSILDNLKPDADTYRTEYRLLRGNGTEAFLVESARGFFDAEGRLLRLVGATTDITEQKRDRLALQETERRFRHMAEAVGDVFWLSLPISQTILYISPTFEEIWGRSCEDLYAHPKLWMEAILPEDLPQVLSCQQSLLVNGHYVVEYRIMRPDGSMRWINERAYATYDHDGQITLTSGMDSDITKSKAMEQTLRQSEARFRTLFESSSDALMLYGEQGFFDCNEAALRMFGCAAREDFIGKHPAQFSPPKQPGGEDSWTLAEEQAAIALQKGIHRFEWQLRRLNGIEFTADVLVNSMELKGKLVLQATVRDITERKAMLLALAQAKEAAEQASQSKSLFLANMSHEIRTPINAVMGMAELCLAADPSEKQRNYLAKIISASNTLLYVINDILDFSKIEANKLDMAEESFTPGGVLESLASLLYHKASDKGLELVVQADSAFTKRAFLGDPQRLGQILINLVGNAIKFSSRGQVLVSLAEEGCEDGMAILHFAVRDEGIGISDEERARLFQAFSQADASTTRKYGGTGLGLSISRRLVEMMGGRIWVDSTPGQGSTFHFTARFAASNQLPEAHPAYGTLKIDSADLARLQGADILVVEDAELNQQVLREMLEQAGLRVRLANNGEEALCAVDEAPPDCVLMDCQMPVMDGYEATRRLRAQERYRVLPIIALTANAMVGDREYCLAVGMNDFVTKPVNFGKLYAALVQWVPPRQAAISDLSVANASQQALSLPELPGIDTVRGCALTGGKPPFYVNLLKKFRDSQASDFQNRFQEALWAGDWTTASRLAHSLKGIAKTLGANPLGNLAARLEDAACNRPEAVTELLNALIGELERVLSGLARIEETVAATAPTACPDPWHTLVSKLDQLLEQQDFAAVHCVASLEQSMADGEHCAKLTEIARLVNQYDFSEARKGLRHLALALNLSGEWDSPFPP